MVFHERGYIRASAYKEEKENSIEFSCEGFIVGLRSNIVVCVLLPLKCSWLKHQEFDYF